MSKAWVYLRKLLTVIGIMKIYFIFLPKKEKKKKMGFVLKVFLEVRRQRYCFSFFIKLYLYSVIGG